MIKALDKATHHPRAGGELPVISPFEIGLVILTAVALIVPGLWAYTLVDPWEGHYAEVARRILEERDWVFLRWQDEVFQSKPVLPFWLMAASMTIFGIAGGGGYSGELVSSATVVFALRLPFAIFGVFGLVMSWYALAVLATRRVAWIALAVLATTPFYFLIARQAITDMPMVSCLIGAVACFALAAHESGERPLVRFFRGRISGLHVFLAVFTLLVGVQAMYYLVYFVQNPGLARGVGVPAPQLVLSLPMLAAVAGMWLWCLWLQPVRTRRQLSMLWFYLLIGISVLAKGPPALAVAGGTCLLYLIVSGRWRLILEVEIPRGLLLAAAVALPWHFAMFFKAGMPYYNEYVHYHLLGRAGEGVHGDRGTFGYYAAQLGIGMWPWSGLVPAAVVAAFSDRRAGPGGHVRLVVALWAMFAVAMFCLVQTKFHHYIFPAVPALALLVAFFVDDLVTGRIVRAGLASLIAVALIALIGVDLARNQSQLIDLAMYLPGRAWPSGPPWNLDLSPTLWTFTLLFILGFGALAVPRWRRQMVAAVLVLALVWSYWAMNGYMTATAPHWGQRELHRTYYAARAIHGVEVHYGGLRELADDWGPEAGDYEVRSLIPEQLREGQPARVRLWLPGRQEAIELAGRVSKVGHRVFWINVDASERAGLAELIARGRQAPPSRRPPHVHVDADRLLAWMINWRSENFWSGGEIWGRTAETQTVFDGPRKGRDNDAFVRYLEELGREGQTYFVITQRGHLRRLESLLPSRGARRSLKVRDDSCNKFVLMSFTL
jgi:4-amino-4-deoxy-L-arabinose transferase-like glycosyltransferase